MNVKKIIPFVILFIGTHCFSQDESNTDVTDVTKVNFLSPGISYEKRIARYQSLCVQGFMSFSGALGYSSSLGFISALSFDPGLSVAYRYYYNIRSREERGRRVAMNSANYLSPYYSAVFSKRRVTNSYYDESSRRPINTLGAVWGMQRNYNSRFSLELTLGIGYVFTKNNFPDGAGQTITEHWEKLTTVGGLSLGFWLNRRKQE